MVKKVLGWAVVAFLVFYVVSNPTGAAGTVNYIGSGLLSIGAAFGAFFTSLTGGGRR